MPTPKPSLRPFTPDEQQRRAIEHVHGPMLVIAGAGTGKTSVLTNRVARLVNEGLARPDEILALTYTKNAAAEMGDRITRLLGGKSVHTATFHDYCYDLMKRSGKDFGVLDETDLWIYLRRRIRELHLDYFVRAANIGAFLKDLLGFLSRCHDELVTPEKYAAYVEKLERGELPIPRVTKSSNEISDQEVLGRCREIARVFALTEQWLREENFGTFSHMITGAHALLHSDSAMRADAASRARLILVDEFQDVNFAQVKILASLAGTERNIFAVGDPDQAIYRFRGASNAAFELFHHQFPSAKVVVLGKNRRSTTPILRCAFALIDKNPAVFARTDDGILNYQRAPLQSARDEEAARISSPAPTVPVAAVTFAARDAESADIVTTIRDLRKKLRCKWSDFGVLYRANFHRDSMVRDLADSGVPFLIQNMDVSDTPEVRDLFACLSAVVEGDDVGLFRAAALPQFQVDPGQLRDAMRTIAKESKDGPIIPLASVLDKVKSGRAVLRALTGAREEIARRQAIGRAALEIIARHFQLDTAYPITQAALKFVECWERKKINKTTGLDELLAYLALFREAGGAIPLEANESEDAVRLMTVHQAKGLEFAHVFILRAYSPLFPNSFREDLVEFPNDLRDKDSAGEGDAKTLNNQEERRLFYVAMTRARDTLHLYAKQGIGKKDKTPPGYIRELLQENSLKQWFSPREVLPVQAPMDLLAGASPAYAASSRIAEWLDLAPAHDLHARLSASAVDTYERCPLQFKLERDWKVARKPAAAMQYGASMHRVLRDYFESVKAGRPRTDEELLDFFRTDLAAAGIQEKYQHELYEKQGLDQLKDFLAKARSGPPPEVLHTEEWFEVQVGKTTLAGRIDRIDRTPNGVVVIDYKTGKARDQKNANESLQLSVYALAAREKWGYDVDSLVFYNMEENVPVSTHRSDLDLKQAVARVEDAAAGIAAQQFRAKPDFYCSFCAYRTLCPAKERRLPGMATEKSNSTS